jgi:integrase
MSDIKAVEQTENTVLSPETAQHVREILDEGTAPETRRAYQGDLAYFWAWAAAACGYGEFYPVPLAMLIVFITTHLRGLPEAVDAALVASGAKARLGPHSLATVRRRVSALSVAHELQGLPNPCREAQVRRLLAKAARAASRNGVRATKKRAATLDIINALSETCGGDLRGLRDSALILFAFASGGRRRSEVAAAKVDDLTMVEGGYIYHLPFSKTDQEGKGREVPVLGRAALALQAWLEAAGIVEGHVFRAVHGKGRIGAGISARTVARIVQRRAEMAGFDPSQFGGHSLRSGFVTESGRRRVPRNEAMELTGHKSSAVFDAYYQAGSVLRNQAARIADE